MPLVRVNFTDDIHIRHMIRLAEHVPKGYDSISVLWIGHRRQLNYKKEKKICGRGREVREIMVCSCLMRSELLLLLAEILQMQRILNRRHLYRPLTEELIQLPILTPSTVNNG